MEVPIPDEIRQVIARLEAEGHQTWLAGGSLRDILLGRQASDWDLTTSAGPATIQEILADAVRMVPTGVKFGTVKLVFSDLEAEITTFRGSSLTEDLVRRDFTINAMAWHPRWGLQDPCFGREDLRARLLRCPGSAKEIFSADPLRMVRAARFAAQLDFELEDNTRAAMGELNDLVRNVSPERIREELSAILTSPRPRMGFELLRDCGLLSPILPELQACVGFDQHNPHHHMDVYEHTLVVMENTPRDLVLRLAALFHDLGKPLCLTVDQHGIGHFYGHEEKGADLAEEIMGRLRYSKGIIATVKKLVGLHMLRLNYPQMNPAKFLARVGPDNVDHLFSLQEADARAGVGRSLQAIGEMRAKVKEAMEEKRPFSRADLAISGRDLLALKLPEGAQMGIILDKLVEAVIRDPRLNQRETLLNLAEGLKKQGP